MSRNRVIGANGTIPWHLPEELKRFKRLTMGHHIIMGRKTWESIGRLLPGRTTVIVTRQRGYQVPGAKTAHSLDEAIDACGSDNEIFVIGGAEIYAQALPRAGKVYLTTVDTEVAGDAAMPTFENDGWRVTTSDSFASDDWNPHSFRSVTYERAS